MSPSIRASAVLAVVGRLVQLSAIGVVPKGIVTVGGVSLSGISIRVLPIGICGGLRLRLRLRLRGSRRVRRRATMRPAPAATSVPDPTPGPRTVQVPLPAAPALRHPRHGPDTARGATAGAAQARAGNGVLGQRVVILKDEKLERYLLIWVGLPESTAIAMELQNEKAPRPLTADLLKSIIDELGARVADVGVTDLADDVFYARIGLLNAQNERLDVDARPSDAIALAVRFDAPIFVEDEILDKASITLPTDQDDRLDVYRDFVNQLFQEVDRRPDA